MDDAGALGATEGASDGATDGAIVGAKVGDDVVVQAATAPIIVTARNVAAKARFMWDLQVGRPAIRPRCQAPILAAGPDVVLKACPNEPSAVADLRLPYDARVMTAPSPASPAPAEGPGRTKAGVRSGSALLVGAPLALILALGLGLRLAGITHGQPFIAADEWIVGKGAMHVLTARTWNVTYYYYPTLLTYLLVPIAALLHVVGNVPLTQSSPFLDRAEALPSEFPIFLAGRLLVAVLGLATVLVSFESARRLVGARAALVAAAVVAFSGVLVLNSEYLVTDVPSALMAALTLLAAIIAWQRRSLRWVLSSALLAGLAASTKYNVGLVVVVAVMAWASLVPWRQLAAGWTAPAAGRLGRLLRALEWRTAVLIPVLAFVGLVVATPAVILAPGLVRDYLQLQASAYQIDSAPLLLPSLGYNLQYLWDTGLGPVASVLVLIGLVRFVVRHRAPELFILVFGLAYLVLMSAPPLHFSRNLAPLIPFAAIAAAEAARFLVQAVRAAVPEVSGGTTRSRSLATGAAVAVIVVALLNPFGRGVAATSELAKTDTRVLAYDWLEANVPAGAAIARDGYTPVLVPPRFAVQPIVPLTDHDIAWYRTHGFAYIVLADYSYGRWPPGSAEAQAFSAMLALPVAFHAVPGPDATGPTIFIVRL